MTYPEPAAHPAQPAEPYARHPVAAYRYDGARWLRTPVAAALTAGAIALAGIGGFTVGRLTDSGSTGSSTVRPGGTFPGGFTGGTGGTGGFGSTSGRAGTPSARHT